MNTTYEIQGMHCDACTRRVSTALQKIPGVAAASVTLNPPRARIESAAPVPLETVSQAVGSAGNYSASSAADEPTTVSPQSDPAPRPSLYPLVLIVLYLLGAAALATFLRGTGTVHDFMNDFMAGFFFVFSFFKLLDLRGFADAYQSYDIIAQRSRAWAFVYPFIELAIGVAYLVQWEPTITNSITLALMLTGSIGVLRAVLRKDRIRCACLGTALNLPMTTVTVVEDLGMAAMAAAMLLWHHPT